MATIHNSDLSREIVRAAKIQQNVDSVPNQLDSRIIPTMEVNPDLLRKDRVLGSATSSATGSFNLLTTSATKETYITGLQANYRKNSAADNATGTLVVSAVIDGATINLITFSTITATAENSIISIVFQNPIKIDRNTSIAFSGAFTAGVMVRAGNVYGYEIENPNA